MEEYTGYVMPSEPLTPGLRKLLEYWQTKCSGGRLPTRADIDPADLSFLLPNLFLIDVNMGEEARNRFRFRLFGTELARVHGRDRTGKTFHETLEEEPADGSVTWATRLVNERIPLFVGGRVRYLRKEWLQFENAMLPLQNDGGEVSMILGATIYTYPSAKGGVSK
ncbi:MAG TPA: PAS domain-containing protein [Verrucomicrobiae bacterium]|nr:PAS domain-containing protein [Verrucomicrobiae bacterium]